VITNDDGIHSPGIRALWMELSSIADIAVVAPDSERSACSQSITVHHPIRVDEYPVDQVGVTAWSVNGTPTDCIKVALEALLPRTPDIVVSGINNGPNLGTDVLYSGTVSAAIEASLHGLPAVAVSLAARRPVDFSVAARYTRQLVERVMAQESLPQNTLLNVNVPPLAAMSIKGVAITKLGKVSYENVFEKRQDPRGRVYYWMAGNVIDAGNDPDSDVEAVKAGYVSVTPVHFDLTNYAIMDMVKGWDW
jgi:5'-nucleotidase